MKYGENARFSELICDMVVGIAEQQKAELPKVYDDNFREYYTDYLKGLGVKTSMSSATATLNRDFLKNVIGSCTKTTKDYSLTKGYQTYLNVSAYTKLKLMQKYGVNSFRDLKEGNQSAKHDYQNYILWQKGADAEFSKRQIKLKQSNLSPNAFMSQAIAIEHILTGALIGGVGGGMLHTSFADYDTTYKDTIAFGCFAAILGAAVFGIMDFLFPKYVYVQDYVKNYGFENSDDLHTYLQQYLAILPLEDKKTLVNGVIDNYKLAIVKENGFLSIEEATRVANLSRVDREITLVEALTDNATAFDFAKQNLALKYGLSNFDDALKFLDVHKILVGEKEAFKAWSEYAYDTPQAKALAVELGRLDKIQAQALSSLNNQTWPRVVADYGEYQNMMLKLKMIDSIDNSFYQTLLKDEDYAYGYDNAANVLYSEIVDEYGIDKTNSEFHIEHHTTLEMLDNLDMDWNMIIGASCGGVLGGTVRSLPFIKNLVSSHKCKKIIEQNDAIDQQINLRYK